MATKIVSLQTIASRIPSDRIRDLILLARTTNMGTLGALSHHHPPSLFDLQTGKQLETPFTIPAVGMAFRPTEKTEINAARNQEVAIVHGDNSPRVVFYDITLGALLEPLALARATAVVYSKQGDKLALGTSSGRVCLYDLDNGHRRQELCSVQVCKSSIVRVEFSGQGECVFALTAGGAVYCIEVRTGLVTQRDLSGGDEDADFECWAHCMHEDARLAAIAGSVNRKSGTCNVWILNIDRGNRQLIRTGHKVYVRRVIFFGADQLAVLGDNGVEVYDLSTRAKSDIQQGGVKVKMAFAAFQVGTFAFAVGSANPVQG